jgi:uncharacterized membrane protein (UPF0182 family)
MRPRFLILSLAALLIGVLVTLSIADEFIVDWLWFGSLGFASIFATRLIARCVVFSAVGALAFGAIFLSGTAALGLSRERDRLRVVRRNGEFTEVNLPEMIRQLGDRIPWRVLIAVAALVLAVFIAVGEASGWDTYLKAAYGGSFGVVDPAFGRDVGFYVFTLPLLEDLRDLLVLIIFLTAAVTAVVYWARGGLDFRETPPRIAPGAIAHLSLLLGLFFVQRAFGYWLDRYGLLFHTNGVVFGLRYVDEVLWRPGLWLLAGLSIGAAMLCFANYRERGARIPIFAAAMVFVPAIILNFIQPLVEKLLVKPDELHVERPYIARNIEMTRHAYKIDGVDVQPFAGGGRLTMASLGEDRPTINNIRLWDPRPLIATYRQLQEIRLYYDFRDVEIDRYTIEGKYSQVMLSARELNPALLPENAQTWVNQHLKFTHGAGVAMSPVNAKDSEGLPIFYVKNIPPVSSVGLQVALPSIYFGEEPDNYAVVKASTPEFDYPRGADNAYSFYQGDAGISVSGFARRLLFSYYYRDLNLLFTEAIINKSRILIRRNITDRLGQIAPFLIQDHDPYIVLHNGRLYWLMDCYTTSDHYPYSQRNADGLNYIRNSVKVVIDAYTGDTTLYVADPGDPIIQCWQKIFPALFKPIATMDPDMRAHTRYPEDFFLVQTDIYRTYHMTDPQVFYNREDLWGFPRETYEGDTVTMQPYYVIMRLPGNPREEYILMLPMVPQGRDNMISWMAARCDGTDYGHLFEYSFSKDKLFYGPYQIQARINQNPEISRQLSLWNQMGSKVILGNLIVIPLQDSLLYVEPLYIRAENGQLPELDRVIASYSDRVVMGEDLGGTLQALFKGTATEAPVIAQAAPIQNAAVSPMAPVGASVGALPLQDASDHYARAMTALKSGDWSQFGTEMQSLGAILRSRSAPDSHGASQP